MNVKEYIPNVGPKLSQNSRLLQKTAIHTEKAGCLCFENL